MYSTLFDEFYDLRSNTLNFTKIPRLSCNPKPPAVGGIYFVMVLLRANIMLLAVKYSRVYQSKVILKIPVRQRLPYLIRSGKII
jgi:hypothetical protein